MMVIFRSPQRSKCKADPTILLPADGAIVPYAWALLGSSGKVGPAKMLAPLSAMVCKAAPAASGHELEGKKLVHWRQSRKLY